MEQIGDWFDVVRWELLLTAGLRVLLILVLAWVGVALAGLLTRRLERRMLKIAEHRPDGAAEARKRATTLAKLVGQGVFILIWTVAGLMVLQELGVSVGPLLASAGIVGLAIGFGAQNLVRDIISGFFLILENQVRVGDVAIVNGTAGAVEEINFRTLILRDLRGAVHIFPNGSITTLTNMTKGWSAYVFEIPVAFSEDTDRVIRLIRQVAEDLRADSYFGEAMTAEGEILGVDAIADSSLLIKGRLRTVPGRQWETGREFLRRLKQRFDAEGVKLPYPHRAIHLPEVDALRRMDGGGTEAKDAQREYT